MRPTPIRALAALVTAGVLAGAAYAPTVVESGTSADRSLRRTQLSVHVGCSTDGYCSATAQGGTGVYESWEWYGAYEDVDDGGSWSTATFDCASGYVMQIAARVTDSSGAKYLGETLVFCPN